MLLPDAIDDYAGRQRIGRAGDGFGEFETLLATVETLRFAGRQDCKKMRRSKVAGVVLVTANPDMCLLGLLLVGNGLQHRIGWRKRVLQYGQLLSKPSEVSEPDA